MFKIKTLLKKIRKVIIPSMLLCGGVILTPILVTSCSHIPNNYETTGFSTVPNEQKTIIKLKSSDNIEFTKEYFWDNLDWFKQLIVDNNIFLNTTPQVNEISIPYSAISAINQENKKSFTTTVYLQKYYYNGKLIELIDTSFGLGSDQFTTSISRQQYNDFLSLPPTTEETKKIYLDYIFNNLNEYFSSLPLNTNREDLVIKSISTSVEKIEVKFELKSLYSISGLKSKEFTLIYTPRSTSLRQQYRSRNTRSVDNLVTNNVNLTKVQFILE